MTWIASQVLPLSFTFFAFTLILLLSIIRRDRRRLNAAMLASKRAARREAEMLDRRLQRHSAELEQRVAERTANLQARNQDLDTFAQNVAHDLRNPIHNIIGYSELLQTSLPNPDEEQKLCLAQLYEGALEMERIVDSLLLLSRVRDEAAVLEPVDMRPVIRRAQTRLATMVDAYQASIQTPKEWPTVYGYEPWLEGVWFNYLSNGIKYGGPSPTLEIGASRQEDGMVRFWVRDSGGGMTAQQTAMLFKPFTQLQNDANGHGLGLSIVHRIITKMGGTVGVDSEIGQGSVFWFTLPPASMPRVSSVITTTVNGRLPALAGD